MKKYKDEKGLLKHACGALGGDAKNWDESSTATHSCCFCLPWTKGEMLRVGGRGSRESGRKRGMRKKIWQFAHKSNMLQQHEWQKQMPANHRENPTSPAPHPKLFLWAQVGLCGALHQAPPAAQTALRSPQPGRGEVAASL